MKLVTIHIIVSLMLCMTSASARQYYLLKTVSGTGGGSYSTSPTYTMSTTIGQSLADKSSGGGGGYYVVTAGFWEEIGGLQGYFSKPYFFSDGWNLVSVPNTVPDYHKGALFSGAVSTAYGYSGSYVPTDLLSNGAGYWVKYAGPATVTLGGVPRIRDTIRVKTGWNMIGSIGTTVGTASIVQIPPAIVSSSYFGYSGGYSVADSIEPWKGYWVKVGEDGQLVLQLPSSLPPSSKAASTADGSGEMNTLAIETIGGKKDLTYRQKLLFGTGANGENLERFEMPPKAPASKLDVRFGSNRYVERFTGDTKELPVSIESNGSSLQLSVSMKEHDGSRYSLVARKGEKLLREYRLEEGKPVRMTPEEGLAYALRVDDLPLSYSLEQNYPNPFNPTTMIRYALPVSGHVTLKVFDMLGREVAKLIDQAQESGYQSQAWDASNVASGVYFYRVTVFDETTGRMTFTDVKKMMLVR
ncbi:MAG TPA: T9SS type A sorting domain-containing protein [Bacteroidota bacterium]|nr:T9SS type A sorting domain-containing protein [Bacteroidota bacterium]